MTVDKALLIAMILLALALLFMFLCEPAKGQVVSFAPQGSEVLKALVGRTIPGVAAVDVQVCSGTQRRIPAGLVYQGAVSVGISPVSPLAMDALVTSELGRNRWRIAASALNIGTHTGTVLLASGVIAATSAWTTGFAVGAGLADTISDRLRARIPSFEWRKNLLEGDLDVPAGACANRLMFALYNKQLTPRMVDLGVQRTIERPISRVEPEPEGILMAELDVPFSPERRR